MNINLFAYNIIFYSSVTDANAESASLPPVVESTNQIAPSCQVYEAIYEYESTAEGDLNFRAGDVIEVSM